MNAAIIVTAVLVVAALLLSCGGGGDEKLSQIVIERDSTGKLLQSRDGAVVATGDDATRIIIPSSGRSTSFRFVAENFFSGAGDHFAVMLYGTIDLSIPRYQGRGVILHRDWGVLGERYWLDGKTGRNILQGANGGSCPNDGSMPNPEPSHDMVLADGVSYSVRASGTPDEVTYTVDGGGQVASSTWRESYDHISLTGDTLALAVILRNDEPFRLTITE